MGAAQRECGDGRTCRSCTHFIDDPGTIEAEFPGIPVFGSAYSSARGHAGICEERGRFMDPLPAGYCETFAPREEHPRATSGAS